MVGGGGVGGGEASRSFPNISSLWALFIVWVKSKRPSAYVGFCLRGMSPRQPQLAPIGGERAEDISISRHTASSAATTRAASVLAESVPLGRVSRLPSRGSSHGTAIVSRVTSSSSASTAPSTQLTPQLRSPSAEELQERVTAYAATLAARTRDLASSLSAGAALSAAFARGGGIFPDDAAIAAAATAGLKELGPISASLGWSASKAHARSPSFTSSGLSATLSPPHMGASATAARLALSSRAVSTPTSGRPGITGSRETSYSLESEKFCEKNGEGPSSFNSFDCHEQYCADAFDNGDLQRRENNGDDWPFSRKISVSTQAILSAREKDDYYRGEMPSESPLSPGAARETTERHESSAAFSAERQTKVSFAAHSLDPVKALSFKERLKSVKPKVFVRPRKPPEFAERVEQERREELLKHEQTQFSSCWNRSARSIMTMESDLCWSRPISPKRGDFD
ncbi:hypothetical protein DFJ73DRAFT_337941 [Zopfochytrium polystomum]|nr:hypothetical protein DFJ73DRAFT_337941 [Zopfochytrium polystomum]